MRDLTGPRMSPSRKPCPRRKGGRTPTRERIYTKTLAQSCAQDAHRARTCDLCCSASDSICCRVPTQHLWRSWICFATVLASLCQVRSDDSRLLTHLCSLPACASMCGFVLVDVPKGIAASQEIDLASEGCGNGVAVENGEGEVGLNGGVEGKKEGAFPSRGQHFWLKHGRRMSNVEQSSPILLLPLSGGSNVHMHEHTPGCALVQMYTSCTYVRVNLYAIPFSIPLPKFSFYHTSRTFIGLINLQQVATLCMQICMFVTCMHACMHVRVYVHHTYIHTYIVCVCVCVCVCVYTCMYVCYMYVYVCVYIERLNSHVCVCVYMYVCMLYVCLCMCVYRTAQLP